MCLLAKLQQNVEEVDVATKWANHCFRVFMKYRYSRNFFWSPLYAWRICTFFLSNELNVLEKSTNNSVSSRFFATATLKEMTDRKNLRLLIDTSEKKKKVLIFLKKFSDLRLDSIVKQGIVNLSCNCC